jgi:hypothetical protein
MIRLYQFLTATLVFLTLSACTTTPVKLTGKSRREPPQDGDSCIRDVRSDADRRSEAAMADEFNKGFFPNIPISGVRWYCFYPDVGLRLDEQTYSRSGKDIIDDKYGARYNPAVQGFVGHYPQRPNGPADESRNEIRMTKTGTLVIEYALKKNDNPGCPDSGPSLGDPQAYALQHMEVCVPDTQIQKLLYPSK